MKRVYPCAAWRIFCGSSPRIGNSSVKPDPLFVIVPQRQSRTVGGVVETKSPHIPAGSIPAFLLQNDFLIFINHFKTVI
ncbi:hypothetical protein DK094_06810 [Salmonella enterica subsp. enterica]|nr:hypothetical protein [Salmonella enterica subsp. enterica serovar Telelkebir]EAQ7289159.1 hypothetical protein [Salmonella enterica]EBS3300122.1 hypothetical protein [Salmonella enterica subsp. enterica serovar Grumpensis]ECD7654782.1 hypothetical protein [Salmonella enterica subsp. enterica serovar Diguel]ECF3194728.1 hypothetical protein [Salmonella enterica subsp. enterica]